MSAANQHLMLCIIDEVEIFEHSGLLQTMESSVSVCIEPQWFFKSSLYFVHSQSVLQVWAEVAQTKSHCCPGNEVVLLHLPSRRHLLSDCMQPYLSCTSIFCMYCQEKIWFFNCKTHHSYKVCMCRERTGFLPHWNMRLFHSLTRKSCFLSEL